LDLDSVVNGKVTLSMWGADVPLLNATTIKDAPACIGPLIRDPINDDKVLCSGITTINLSSLVKFKLGDNLILRLVNHDNTIKGFYKNSILEFQEIAGFKYKSESKLLNQMTHSIYFHGSIPSCDFMKPIETGTFYVKNNGRKMPIKLRVIDKNFECKNKANQHISNGVLTQKVL
jgi:hypothetical protein